MPCVSNVIEGCEAVRGSDYCCRSGIVHTVSSWYVSNLGKREKYGDLAIKAIIESRCCDL